MYTMCERMNESKTVASASKWKLH